MTGIDELRRILHTMDCCQKSFLNRFTIEEIIQIYHMWVASSADYYPDTWTDTQLREALAGKPPQWDQNGNAILNVWAISP